MSDLEWVKILIRKIFRKKVLLRKKGVPPPIEKVEISGQNSHAGLSPRHVTKGGR